MNLVYRIIGWLCDRLINLDDWAEEQQRRKIRAEVEMKARVRERQRVTADDIEPSVLFDRLDLIETEQRDEA